MISLPASMTHASMPPEVRKQVGFTDEMIRISVGIEDVEDIIADRTKRWQSPEAPKKRISEDAKETPKPLVDDPAGLDRRRDSTGRSSTWPEYPRP